MTNTSFIIGAYPCAPSFHHKGEQEEQTFWRELSDTPNIRGLEQPCLENLHPLGDEWLFRHTPEDWQIVVTAATAHLAWPRLTTRSVKRAWTFTGICTRKLTP